MCIHLGPESVCLRWEGILPAFGDKEFPEGSTVLPPQTWGSPRTTPVSPYCSGCSSRLAGSLLSRALSYPGRWEGEMSFPVGTVFWGHSLTLKAPVSGSISQREKSVSRSPLLSIFRYPVTPGGMEEDGCVLTGWNFMGPTPHLRLLIF